MNKTIRKMAIVTFVLLVGVCKFNLKSVETKEINNNTGIVTYVTDGDTFKCKNKEKEITVRLIGVDTPESVARNGKLKNTNWGKKASNYTKSVLQRGTKVTLKYDTSATDCYGRTLAYVYYKKNGKNIMLNKQLVAKGYARAVYYAPNGKFRTTFKKAHLKAKEKKKGFWKDGFDKAFPTKNEREY